MTGFGQAAGENGNYRVAVSVRSVNHRFLDLALRLGEDYRDLEPSLRKIVDGRLARGRVEMRVAVDSLGEAGTSVTIDHEIIDGVLAAVAEIDAAGLEAGPVTKADLLRLPEVVRVRRGNVEMGAGDRELILEIADRALDLLIEMRSGEGSQLESFLDERVRHLRLLVDRLAGAREEARDRLLANMRQRVEALLEDQDVTPERLAQETAFLAEKTDVQEELDRLSAHLDTFDKGMKGQEASGRRLDFLAQEIHRELNTLGAKCRDARMAEWVVDAKVACEQIREQVQNVE